jgi:hypothetical protein
MTTAAIIKEIDKLPLAAKLLVVEKTLRAIRQEQQPNLAKAVTALYDDYKTDENLTAFTILDSELFYETR